jgi:hypothetical protein
MHSASTFVLASFWIMVGILLLLWAMPCAVLADRGEKQGFRFWTVFFISLLLSPIAGLLLLSAARSNRAARLLGETVSRS